MVFGEEAQAAIADAIFLLVIVSGLAALMFFFITGTPLTGIEETGYSVGRGVGYGMSVERVALEFYGTDYATSALQTVLYSSTPRHEGETLEEAKEIDYLLAFVKEDYANDRELSDLTKRLLTKDINTVLASSLASHDFIFIMRTIPREYGRLSEFVFVLLKRLDFDASPVRWAYYFCSPGEGREHLIEEKLLAEAGGVIKAQPVILRFRTMEREGTERVFTALNMWPTVSFSEEVMELIESEDDLNCVEEFVD